MARRPLKRHVQQPLFGRRKDGKRRKKPGPKPKDGRGGSAHAKRPVLKARFPVHVVLRVTPAVGSLRKRDIYKAFREATFASLRREALAECKSFRIVHLSIQRTHVHMLVEADDAKALSRGMQSFQISAAKHINAAITARTGKRRRGTVFPDRFHQEILESPRQTRRALSYVLNNWRKHREDREGVARTWKVDPYSTGVLFTGWRELEDATERWKWRDTYDPFYVCFPQTWLLATGWRKAGSISFTETPSKRPTA